MTKKSTVSPLKPLTRKQQAFVKEYVNNPKASATEIAKITYNTKSENGAAQIAFDNLRNPKIVSELAKYNNLVENTLINAVNDYGKSEKLGERALAVDTAKFIHDKVNGKAKQSVEVNSTSISLSIDLSGGVLSPSEAPEKLETGI